VIADFACLALTRENWGKPHLFGQCRARGWHSTSWINLKVKKAVQQAKKPEPDQKTIIEALSDAKTLIAGVSAAAGLLTALTQAIERVRKLL
jgi:hypothetical protein